MSGQQRNKFGNLIAEVQTGLRKLPAQRSTQQKRIIGKLLQCKDLQKQGANVLSTLVKERQNVQQTTPTGQQVQQENAIVNKLQQIDDKYKLNLIQKDWGIGDVDLSSQVSALKKDKDIYQFIKNFDPNSQQSQKQLPIIQTKLNQILKKDGGNLIGKILKGSLEKQKQSTAPPRVASFQKQPQKSNLEPRTLSPTTTNQKRPQIRRASSLQQQDDAPSAAAMAVLNQYYKRKQQTPTQQIQNNAKRPPALVRVASSLQQQQNPKDISNLKPDDYLITKRVVKPSTSQLQRVFQVAKLPQDGTMTNIRENIKKANQQIRTQTQHQNQY